MLEEHLYLVVYKNLEIIKIICYNIVFHTLVKEKVKKALKNCDGMVIA